MVFKECVVPACNNNNENNPNKLFLRVPRDPIRREKWRLAMKLRHYLPKDSICICCCEDHFNLPEDSTNWMYYKTMGKVLRLKPDVVPHKYIDSPPRQQLVSQLTDSSKKRKVDTLLELPSTSTQDNKHKQLKMDLRNVKEKSLSRVAPVRKVLFADESCSPSKSNIALRENEIETSLGTFTVSDQMNIMNISTSNRTVHVQTVSASLVNVGVQVNIRKKRRSIKVNTICMKSRNVFPIITSDQTVNMNSSMDIARPHKRAESRANTSSESMSTTPSTILSSEFNVAGPSKTSTSCSDLEEAENIFFQQNRRKSTIQFMEWKSRFYLGLPGEIYVLVRLLTTWLNITHLHILVTPKKIRLNDTYSRLADDFGMSLSNVSKIFVASVPKIANVMQNFVFWPDSEKIKRTLPIPFRYRYNNVQSIIDCLEIEIEKLSNPLKQSLTWSEYKKCNTIKFLISCTPNGFINFISGAFAGRISDNNIVNESGYLNYLPNDIDVMADRGFKQIDNVLMVKRCRLIRPPSVSSKQKPTKDQVREAKRIASLRIHVERVIRRMREFEMLHMHSCLNNNLVILMNHIVIISCGLINLQEPLIK